MDIITAIGDIINILKEKTTDIAKDTKFLVRKGKITPFTFVLALITGISELHEITLKTILIKCEDIQKELKISKQALFKRMEAGSALMEALYKDIFNETSKEILKIKYLKELNRFTDVYLTDASTISLPDKLVDEYKGLGGKNSISALKIQTTYSILQQKITALEITDATQNDTTNNQETIKNIKAGELYIKDLGYYSCEYFSEIKSKQAYYLSRIKTNTKLFEYNSREKKYHEIDYCKLLKSAEASIDREMYINFKNNKMFKVRLVCIKLPEEIISKRLFKANKEAKSKGKTLTKKEKLMLRWNVFITNVETEMLSAEKICQLYRLRWQIELIFKAIKSSLSFDNFGFAGKYYFRCLLYGKLILLLTEIKLYSMSRATLYKHFGRLVSIQSFFRNLRPEIHMLTEYIINSNNDILDKFSKKLSRIAELSLYDKRKRKMSEEVLMYEYHQSIDIKGFKQVC